MAAQGGFEELLGRVTTYPARVEALGGSLLTNLAMVAEIPAPTFHESARAQFLRDRLTEVGYQSCHIDAQGNVAALLPGSDEGTGEDAAPTPLLVAHLDTPAAGDLDHTVSLAPESAHGVAVADNALGVAALASLPAVLEELDVQPPGQIAVLASTGGLGDGDIRGLRFFLAHTDLAIDFGICVEGVQLGRLSHGSVGMIRGAITCRAPADEQPTAFGSAGAIPTLNEVIDGILALPMPARPKTSVVLSQVRGGSPSIRPAASATVHFVVRSEAGRQVTSLVRRINEIVAEVDAASAATVELNIVGRRQPGGLPFDHPLVARTHRIMRRLELQPHLTPSTSELAAFISEGVPAITLGMSFGHDVGTDKERVSIDAMYTGVAQLVAVIEAIEAGYCR